MSPFALNRRTFLEGAATLAAVAPGLTNAAPQPRGGRLSDVEHVVILMQENRSFDHYHGTMRGVRGFGDQAGIDGVFSQADPKRTDGGALLPFHVDTLKVDGQDLGDLAHGWSDQHRAVALGANDAWVPAKSEMTMGYFTNADIPFHRALADAFTICDAYHCSIQGPTTPNRLYLFSGMIDADGRSGGPAISNPADYKPVFRWTTYPERLQDAGVSWKVYANKEVGDDGAHPFVGDYGDNPLWLFDAYHRDYGSDLSKRAGVFATWEPDSGKGKDVHHVLADFEADCRSGSLPTVSWIVAPYGWCEHPEARPVDGAVYTQAVLNALWANPALRDSTAVFINYDENDGFYDHVPPPLPPAGTASEFVQGLPIGLGTRVPMTVISPWSHGGWVNSELADHTSVIRFLETMTGVQEPNITAWRRAVCGDLTSCFDFGTATKSLPRLPDSMALQKQADATQTKLAKPAPPAVGKQVEPVQESGTRPARPLPYQPLVTAVVSAAALTLTATNTGAGAVPLTTYGAGVPRQSVVPAGGRTTDAVPVSGAYDVTVHGPNRFVARFAGGTARGAEVTPSYDGTNVRLTFRNTGTAPARFTLVMSRYGTTTRTFDVTPGGTASKVHRLQKGWYDATVTVAGDPAFVRRFTGRVENGKPGVTG